jgi:hypothetical protein
MPRNVKTKRMSRRLYLVSLLHRRGITGVEQDCQPAELWNNVKLPETMMKSRRLMVFPLPRTRLGAGICITFYN